MVEILRLPAVRQRTGLSTSQVYDGLKHGWFPKPVKLFPNSKAVGWPSDEVDAYIELRRRARNDALLAAKKVAAEQPLTAAPTP